MIELAETAEQVAVSDANVLLVGESGVGKEVMANLLHSKSSRAGGPMVKLNCAAFPPHLIEGELFGYKKGAFTGALQDFPGMLSAASGGTLFLDEIAEMPIELQTRFLRVLQEREYKPLGSTQTHRADFRLIAASNRNPEDAIRTGKLREDLFYRLNTFTFVIPPLRERADEIVDLCDQFLKRFGEKLNKNVVIAPETYEILLHYSWPGNVRELQNVIERAVVLAKNGRVTPDNLPPELFKGGKSPAAATQSLPAVAASSPSTVLKSASLNLEDCEKAAIVSALEKSGGNKKKAAEILGIHRPTLYAKMKKYGLLGASESAEE
jgi:transcriptional regulator with PAS, ATPase and Fis domain